MLPLPTLIACTWNRQPTTALRIYNTSSVSMCKRRAHMRSILFINTSMSASCVYRTRSVCSQAATAEEMQFSLDMFDYILLSHEYVDDIQSSVKLLVVFVVSFFFCVVEFARALFGSCWVRLQEQWVLRRENKQRSNSSSSNMISRCRW